jgi:hypothetical protein
MTFDQFAYWIQGVFEGKTSLTSEQQIQLIKDHLKLVMTKVTPTYPPGTFDPVILPSTGAGDHWSIPRNPLQDLPTYIPPNPFSVGPICSSGTGTGGGGIATTTQLPPGSVTCGPGIRATFTGDSTGSTLECGKDSHDKRMGEIGEGLSRLIKSGKLDAKLC